jgi:DNA-binding NarL/FixJ family response regulator
MIDGSDRITVVIADDHRTFGEALEIALDKEPDLDVIEVVTDGESAIRVTADRHPDVVLIDLQMPGVDGLQATRSIRATDPDTTVIILTGTEDELSLGRAVQAGAQGFLQKTEAVADLAGAIRRARRGEPLNAPEEVESSLRGLRRRRDRDQTMSRRMDRLTPREIEILQRMTDGMTVEEICADLGMTKNTLRTHTQNVLTKLGVHSKTEAIVAAIRHGKVRTAGEPLLSEPDLGIDEEE